MNKPQISTEAYVTESYVVYDENGVPQLRIEATGDVRGIDDILTFLRKSLS